MNKFISLFSACAVCTALLFSNVYASDNSTTKSPLVVKPTPYIQSGGVPVFSDDYYNSIYNDGRPQHRYQYKPTYTPINKSSYYNQNIPNSAVKNEDNNYQNGVYPWNVKYTYTPANQVKYTPASQIKK